MLAPGPAANHSQLTSSSTLLPPCAGVAITRRSAFKCMHVCIHGTHTILQPRSLQPTPQISAMVQNRAAVRRLGSTVLVQAQQVT